MGLEVHLPTLITVVTTAAIDSINPCAIGVLILMLSVILSSKSSVGRMMGLGFLYIFSVFAIYLLAGFGFLYFFSKVPLAIAEYLSIAVGLLIVGAGIIEIKDFYWYGRGFSLHIPATYAKKLKSYTHRSTVAGAILLGAFVSAVELPCTGAPYLATITLLSQYFNVTALLLLVLYNMIFVLPLVIILLLVACGVKLYAIKEWKQVNRPLMRLFAGVLLVAMGWLLILIANGTINLG